MKPGAAIIALALLAALGTGSYVVMKARGIRNRNPGNIEYNPANNWDGQSGSDGRYAVFNPHPQGEFVYGIRAAGKLFRNYQIRYGLNTVASLIARWAPQHENPTDAYIGNVASAMQVNPNTAIDLNHNATLERLLAAVFRQENGIASAAMIPAEEIRKGVALI